MSKNEPVQDNAGVAAPPPLIFAGALVGGLFLQRRLPIKFFLQRRTRLVLGVTLSTASILLGQSAFKTMENADTTPNPLQPTTTIVTAGPYQVTRNPIYTAFALLYAGLSLLTNAVTPLLLLPLVMRVINRGVILREEQYLEKKFGEQYTSYKQRVPRWL